MIFFLSSLYWWDLGAPVLRLAPGRATGREFDVVHDARSQKVQPIFHSLALRFYTWILVSICSPAAPLLHGIICSFSACQQVYFSWFPRKKPNQTNIDNWLQWLSDTAEVWLMLESEVWKWLLPWDRMFPTARFLCELFICLLNRITSPIFLTLTL